jgi:SAM-dependent methyltransferase
MRPGGRILELGTSTVIPLALKELFPAVAIDVTVFDESDAGGEDREVVLSLGDRKCEVYAFALDFELSPLPMPDETYDLVICCEVIEHMEIDPMHTLSEINRVLKPNGRLLLTTPNVVSSRGVAKFVRGIEPYFFMQYNKNGNYHRHNYEYSVHTLTTVLAAAGFTGKVWTEDLFEDPLHEDVDRLRTLGYPLENVGDNIIATATKISGVIDRYPSCIYA